MKDASNLDRTPESVLIVGAGLVGACLGFRLAKAGCSVTIIDTIGPHAGASGRSWAWINAMAAEDEAYFTLRRAGIAAWHELEQDLAGALPLDWTGALIWDSSLIEPESSGAPASTGARLSGARRLTAKDVQDEEPLIGPPPNMALLSAEDGLIDAAQATAVVLDAAAHEGARLSFGQNAEALMVDGDRIIGARTPYGDIKADAVILCAGVGTAGLLETVDIPLPCANRPGLLVTTAPSAQRLKRALWGERVHIKQLRDGRLVIGENAHAPGALNHPAATAQAMLEAAQTLLPSLAPLTLDRFTIAVRPIPGDGLPVIGPVRTRPGLWVATMHSGVTLAAVTARLLTQEILTGRPEDLLQPYRIDRFDRWGDDT